MRTGRGSLNGSGSAIRARRPRGRERVSGSLSMGETQRRRWRVYHMYDTRPRGHSSPRDVPAGLATGGHTHVAPVSGWLHVGFLFCCNAGCDCMRLPRSVRPLTVVSDTASQRILVCRVSLYLHPSSESKASEKVVAAAIESPVPRAAASPVLSPTPGRLPDRADTGVLLIVTAASTPRRLPRSARRSLSRGVTRAA